MLVSSVYTIDVGSAAPGQEGSSHYHYLLRENGGFVERAPSVEEHLRQLAGGLGGDWDPERITRFTESFVRPHGLDRPAMPILASALIDLAGGAVAAPDTATEAPTASRSST